MVEAVAKTSVRWEFTGVIRGSDGYETEFSMDDSFRKSWLPIVRWNLHYGHKRALLGNARDLFTKVIWRKLWRPS